MISTRETVMRVLHREQRDHRLAVDAELMEGLEVGLDARAAARIRTRRW